MKANTHPTYYNDAKVVCSCGNTFTTGATVPEIHVELCNNCHPFYTGQQRFVDTASRIDKFRKKLDVAKTAPKKKAKKETGDKEDDAPQTLREMLSALRK
jgi:large subunit ribosomal protein L31